MLAAGIGAALGCIGSGASASLVYGTLSNFDVYNDTGGRTYGFEIEFDDISTNGISFVWNSPHYGLGQKIQEGTTAKLRWAASFNGSSWTASTAQHPAGGPVATTGHACVVAVGCEHFGAGLYQQPTATRYRWLIEDPNSPGTLTAGPLVSLMAPIYAVIPPVVGGGGGAAQIEVQNEFEAPEFEQEFENEKQYPDAVWARITKYELEEGVALEDLVSDNGDLFANPALIEEEEFEWEIIEKGANPLDSVDKPDDAIKQIVRRIETYRYIGPVTDENEPDCDLIDCTSPVVGVTMGDLIAANMVALNLVPVEFDPAPAPVPVPAAAWLFGSALTGLGALKRRKG
ncbi:MAG: VPLPA-CTERM sorting domain-containing protein [Gammaproteobacteria bacterium]